MPPIQGHSYPPTRGLSLFLNTNITVQAGCLLAHLTPHWAGSSLKAGTLSVSLYLTVLAECLAHNMCSRNANGLNEQPQRSGPFTHFIEEETKVQRGQVGN